MYLLIAILLLLSEISADYPPQTSDAGLTVPEMIRNNGYPCEIHHITTEDGYILEYHRVPYGVKDNDTKKKRFPILIMHGITFSSVQDFGQGPKKAVGYLLADNGFDVWAANYRGNHYSQNHTHIDWKKNPKKFYDYTIHEIGYYDIPAAMDHITSAGAFLVFGATRPEYIKRIRLAALFSPAAYMRHDDIVGEFGVYIKESFWNLIKKQKLWFKDFSNLRKAWPDLVSSKLNIDVLVIAFTNFLKNKEDAEALVPYLGAFVANWPSEFSLKFIAHLVQLIASGDFAQFDYGIKKNKKKYGVYYPPQYNISTINCPVALYYAKADYIIPYSQLLRVERELPNVVHKFVESTGRYSHLSFGGAKDTAQRIWPDEIRILKQFV